MDENPKQAPVDSGQNQPVTPTAPSAPETPAVPALSAEPETQMFKSAKKSRKKMAIILSIVGVIIAAAAAGAVWWFAFYNNDKMILKGAFDNLLTQQSGTINMNLNVDPGEAAGMGEISVKAKVASDDQGNTNADFSFSMGGDAMKLSGATYFASNGDIYVKVGGLEPLVNVALAAMGAEEAVGVGAVQQQAAIDAIFTPIIEKVDDKWIKISADDVKSVAGDVDTAAIQKCVTGVTTKLNDNADLRKNLLEAMQSEDVLTAKRVGTDADGVKYELTIDGTNANQFGKNLANTDIVKQTMDCLKNAMPEGTLDNFEAGAETEGSNAGTEANDALAEANVKIYFWVDRGSREARRMEVTAQPVDVDGVKSGSVKFSMTSDSSKPDMPAAPTNATSFQDLMNDLQSVIMMLMMQQMSGLQTDDLSALDGLEEFEGAFGF
ncbi:hypothetical protein FWG95_00600 [Candidatus Saccharibacteria bacterium]|nr:hypothetical protein [Candidatus Saccharibacteria bacterium]